jgi:hypothetical protein
MRVLIACEESQTVCKAFRSEGHEAYSCDIKPTTGDRPEWHIIKDVLYVLAHPREYDVFDMMIAHPPCTYLCVTGNKWFKPEFKDRFPDRQQQREDAIAFFMALINAPIDRIAVENPVGIMSTVYRKPDQYIQPWQFGDRAVKKTGLWLKNLWPLVPTKIVEPEYVVYKSRLNKEGTSKYPTNWSGQIKRTRMPMLWKMSPSNERTRLRSKTYEGVAQAMAKQWSK